jgi:pyridoxine/pyridoxamine 5'-phosphate oxidase
LFTQSKGTKPIIHDWVSEIFVVQPESAKWGKDASATTHGGHSLDSQEVCEAVKERAQYLHRFVDVVVPRSCCMFTVANSGIELRRGKRNRIHIN